MADSTLTAASNLGLDVDQDAAQAPDDDEINTVMARIKAARASATDPVDLQTYSDAQDDARALYRDQANRAEWTSLADRIGAAGAKFAAAVAGSKAHVDLSHIDTGPAFDLKGAMDTAGKDYTTSLGEISGNREAALRNQQQDYSLADKAFDQVAQSKRQKLLDAHRADEIAAQNTRQDKQIANQNSRDDQRFKFQSDEDDKKDKRAHEFENDRTNRTSVRDDLQGIDAQLKQASIADAAFRQLQNEMTSDPDISNKSADKLHAQYGKLAADAHMDLGDMQSRVNSQDVGTIQSLYNKATGKTVDVVANKKAALEPLHQTILDSISKLQASRAAAIKRLQPGGASQPDSAPSAAAPTPPPQSAAPKRTVSAKDISEYATAHNVTEDAARTFLTNQGYQVQ